MVSFKASDLHRQAQTLLKNTDNAKKLVLLHALIALGSTLLIAGLNILFKLQIAETGGLSGMGARTILSTVQTMLETAVMMALPFWQMSLIFVAINWARNRRPGTEDLLQGFRRFGSVLGLRILYAIIFVVLSVGLLYISSTIFLMTPFSKAYLDAFAPLMDPNVTAEQIEALVSAENLSALLPAMIPLFVIFGVVFLVVSIPAFYRLRLSEFGVMDGLSGRQAIWHSFRTTKRNWRYLVKLDLHFWWFYALQVLCNVIGNGNNLLPILGISLPFGEDAAYFLFFALGTALQILVLWQFRGQVITSYALLYDDLCLPQAEPVLEEA